jgi:phosphorylcholine metabolism protein LicD
MRLRSSIFLAAATLYGSVIAAPQPDVEVRSPAADPEPLQSKPHKPDTKYFHEPGGDDILGHYDIRYFKGNPVTYEERGETLHHMIRAYLVTFRNLGVETWIAHGTLLGWWWNGKIMPWDWDLDTQVSGETLEYLGKHHNMTFHDYTDTSMTDPTKTITTKYLLDINPNARERVRGDGMNVIDARWINTENGLFIDITGLSETHPDNQPGIWSCKNYHKYRTKDLYPMRETTFQGVPAWVPFSYDKILTEEYGSKSLVLTTYEW